MTWAPVMSGETLNAGWRVMESSEERQCFSDIMRQMDRRYDGLNCDAVGQWLERKAKARRRPFLLGRRDEQGRIVHVTAVSERQRSDGQTEHTISMIGVDPAYVDVAGGGDHAIQQWLGQTMYAMALQFGWPSRYETSRPRTMTWKPMERLHDLMRRGLTIRLPGPDGPVLRAEVYEEHDRGHSLFWRISLDRIEPQEVAVDVTVC